MMNGFDPLNSNPEMRRRHKAFQAWQRIVILGIVVAWAVFGYLGYRLLLHFGAL